MIGHILPCVLETELLTVLAYLVAHAREGLTEAVIQSVCPYRSGDEEKQP